MRSVPELILRVGLAGSFIYPAVSALTDPEAWLGYFPGFLLTLAGDQAYTLLHAFGALEVLIALWILFGKDIRIPSGIAFALLVAIVAVNPIQFPVLFRDLSIAAIALYFFVRPHGHQEG